ncbi:MAG TPA: peptide deformylase [Actinomycetota bacterium]|nr:peptide deformylase [Actinomycetota bacterium]
MIRQVLTYPHPALKQPAAPVHSLDAQVLAAAADLVDTMRAHIRCVGLAAPQLGIGLRIVVVDVSNHPSAQASHGLLVLVNPLIVQTAGSEMGREGCQSLPEITVRVRRAKRILFEGTLLDGTRLRSVTSGFEARAILHEIDHLDGVLILDRAASPKEVFRRTTDLHESPGPGGQK